MFLKNTVIEYPLLLLKSIGRRSFAALGRVISRCARTARKTLCPQEVYVNHMWEEAKINFKKSKKLIVQIDATLLCKMYSNWMEGSGRFYDTKLKISYTAYKMIIATMSNGSITLPLEGDFLFEKKLSSQPVPTALDFIKRIILEVKKQFHDKRIIFVLDGDFATEKYLSWCLENVIQTEVRMPSNRVVIYKGKRTAIRDIKALRPKGRQIGRTKKLMWHGLHLHITAHRRCNKKGEYSVVFQAATYAAKPIEHIDHYLCRWPIEKMIRTTKQHCGIEDCYSIDLQTQLSHINACLVAFSMAQLECKINKLRNPEAGVRSIRRHSWDFLNQRFSPKQQQDLTAHA